MARSAKSPRRRAGRLLLGAAAALVVGCGHATSPTEPTTGAWTPPPDWTLVATADGGILLTLPPWLEASDTSGGIFGNEPPPAPGAELPMQLMALGPRADDQPSPGQDLAAWIEGRLAQPGQGLPVVTRVILPAGPAVRYDRTDRAGTPTAWRIVAFAIRTPFGAAYLQFDGPPESWPARIDDLERVAQTARFR